MTLLFQGRDILTEMDFDEDYFEEIGVAPPVIQSWKETGFELTWAKGGVKPQPDSPNLVVFHWTGGEGNAAQVFKTLRSRETRDGRGLSCHLYIDYNGVITQYCDLDTITRHASAVNGRSIGIEMQNRAFPFRDAALEAKADKRASRGVFRQTILGREHGVLGFSAAQLDAVRAIGHLLCDAFEIPKLVPGDRAKVDAAREDQEDGFILTDPFPQHAVSTFRGVCGHYHVHMKHQKLDPGTQPFEELFASGFELGYMDEL